MKIKQTFLKLAIFEIMTLTEKKKIHIWGNYSKDAKMLSTRCFQMD